MSSNAGSSSLPRSSPASSSAVRLDDNAIELPRASPQGVFEEEVEAVESLSMLEEEDRDPRLLCGSLDLSSTGIPRLSPSSIRLLQSSIIRRRPLRASRSDVGQGWARRKRRK